MADAAGQDLLSTANSKVRPIVSVAEGRWRQWSGIISQLFVLDLTMKNTEFVEDNRISCWTL